MTAPRPSATTLFPLEVAEEIMAFLASGCSGTIEIHVHQGIVQGGKFSKSVRVHRSAPLPFPRRRLDETPTMGHDSGI